MLCAICQEVIQNKKSALIDEDGTTLCVHHPTGESLQKAGTNGCHICSMVWSRLAPSQQNYVLELKVDEPITNILMSTPQVMDMPTTLFGSKSLILCVQLEAGKDIWNLPGGSAERYNIFVLQPSEGNDQLISNLQFKMFSHRFTLVFRT